MIQLIMNDEIMETVPLFRLDVSNDWVLSRPFTWDGLPSCHGHENSGFGSFLVDVLGQILFLFPF